ncbi:MAG: hypothetical protein Kow00103_02840 [Candidatus Caldatribacteriota bacterium]
MVNDHLKLLEIILKNLLTNQIIKVYNKVVRLSVYVSDNELLPAHKIILY